MPEKVAITKSKLDDLANAVSLKTGVSAPLTIAQMETAIENMSPLTPTLQSKTNIAPTTSSQTITADSGYDGLSSVQINAMPSGSVTAPQTISGDGASVSVSQELGTISLRKSVSVTPIVVTAGYVSSGTANTTNVSLQASIDINTSSDLTVNGATVTAPAGYYATSASKRIDEGSAGIPTATKGSVSNHSVTVTPSVSTRAGYIIGGNITGTAVTVSASELVSGSETKTQNGTYDVTNLASLVVNVASSGIDVKTATGTFTGNGTRQMTISCAFEPDLIYFTSDPGTTASSGVVAAIIARGLMAASRYRNNSTTNSHYAVIDITAMNTGGSSYSFRATYENSTVTLYCFSNNARCLFTNGRTYSYTFIKYTA